MKFAMIQPRRGHTYSRTITLADNIFLSLRLRKSKMLCKAFTTLLLGSTPSWFRFVSFDWWSVFGMYVRGCGGRRVRVFCMSCVLPPFGSIRWCAGSSFLKGVQASRKEMGPYDKW